MKKLEITIPFPPSVNVAWRRAGKRVHLNPKVVEYRKAVRLMVGKQLAWSFGASRLKVSITLYPPTRRKFDIDNRAKVILDALQHAHLYDDDEQVDELILRRGVYMPDHIHNGCVVTIEEINQA